MTVMHFDSDKDLIKTAKLYTLPEAEGLVVSSDVRACLRALTTRFEQMSFAYRELYTIYQDVIAGAEAEEPDWQQLPYKLGDGSRIDLVITDIALPVELEENTTFLCLLYVGATNMNTLTGFVEWQAKLMPFHKRGDPSGL